MTNSEQEPRPPQHKPAELITRTPAPPYYAVVFSSLRTNDDDDGYAAMAARMEELAAAQPGYLGIESAKGADGLAITISYWKDTESIAAWRKHAEHLLAQKQGKERWYAAYSLKVCKVEAARTFARESK